MESEGPTAEISTGSKIKTGYLLIRNHQAKVIHTHSHQPSLVLTHPHPSSKPKTHKTTQITTPLSHPQSPSVTLTNTHPSSLSLTHPHSPSLKSKTHKTTQITLSSPTLFKIQTLSLAKPVTKTT